jgi:hypothetical protein
MPEIENATHASLQPSCSEGSKVYQTSPGVWRLEIPAGERGRYRLAQLDDYSKKQRRNFPWQPPIFVSLRARACQEEIPGTWGFGLWNNPFSMGALGGGDRLRSPTLPNAAWFFHASPPNHLSLRDDLPAQGWFAATFRTSRDASLLLPLGIFALPLLLFPPCVKWLRRLVRRLVLQDAAQINSQPASWHTYQLEWHADRVRFSMDGAPPFTTPVAPHGPLGLVIWVDNQYLSIPPDGRLRYGTLENKTPAWIEVSDLVIQPGA